MAISHEGGEVHVDYRLMPLTAEETNAGGDFLGARYAEEHQDRWIDVNHLIFELQTYDRGYTMVRINGRTYAIWEDILEGDLNVRLFIGKYIGTAKEDPIGGIQTMELTPKNILTWKEMIDRGIVNDSANLVINYSKIINDDGKTLIGNTVSGGVRLVIPDKTTSGAEIVDISTTDGEAEWDKPGYPAKYICEVILPSSLKSIGLAGPAFPMLGKNVIRHEVSIRIPRSVTTIGKKAFYGSKIKVVSGSKLREFTGDDKLSLIDESAFERCTELDVIHFGSSLKTINSKAFAYCCKLQLYFLNSIETVAEDACLAIGNVVFTPRIIEGEEVPDIVKNAPFQAKLWNGKIGYTPGFYKKPQAIPPDAPSEVLPPGGMGTETDPDRTPLDLSGVINQINTINSVANNIAAPQ